MPLTVCCEVIPQAPQAGRQALVGWRPLVEAVTRPADRVELTLSFSIHTATREERKEGAGYACLLLKLCQS
jgi:hypothetical protein